MDLLLFATTHNYFWFNSKFYIEKKGVAMGIKFTPSLANLFMANWVEDVVYAHDRPELLLCARYIDDVFGMVMKEVYLCLSQLVLKVSVF